VAAYRTLTLVFSRLMPTCERSRCNNARRAEMLSFAVRNSYPRGIQSTESIARGLDQAKSRATFSKAEARFAEAGFSQYLNH
jgi:hypothetical protein